MERPKLRPVVWTPPKAPSRSRARTSSPPLSGARVTPVEGTGPEDVAVDHDGRVITGVEDGRILRLTPGSGRPHVVARTGGRPLGVEVAGDGRLIVCDAQRGLLRVDPDGGAVETLVEAGERLSVCNNSAVARDGAVFFSDSSRRFGLEHWKADLLEHSGTGRLLRRDPNGELDVLAEGLQFANGVALAEDESFVVVVETGAYRLTRVWLTGARAGEQDVLIDNLPGFPDNMATGSGGRFWVALASPRDPVLDVLFRLPPVFRKAAWAMPERLQPQPKPTTWTVAVNSAGDIVHDLQGQVDNFHMATGVREHRGKLFFGSLVSATVASVDLV